MNSNFSSRCSLPQQPSISAFSWYSRRCSRSFAGTRARPSILTPAVHDEFYANKVSSFLDLGVHEDLTRALERNGLAKPAKVQEVVVPALLEDKSAVVAAETGSGKTFAYLLPIATSLMRSKNETRRPSIALVLCPNVALCQQVIAAITSLKDTEGDSLLSACQVNSSNPPPFDRPDFVVATPAGLLDLFINSQGAYGGLWTLNGFQEHVKYVVLDEADLLLDQAYIQAVSRILEAFRVSDRRKVEAQSILEMGMTDLAFSRLPRHLRHACWKGGAPGLMDAGYRKGTKSETGQFGPYWQRQYVFVAATMPAVTRSDVGSQIQKMYPDIQWIATEALHTSKKQITHQWAEVADDNWGDRLVQVIQEDPDYKQGSAKILVFAKDTASADLASKLLTSSGVPHGVYHKRRPLAERNESLRRMQESQSGVLVCTDSAARGLDIPDVSHVIQSDFAANTIDFIHRIGRTGRAAKAGKVTSLYREHNVPLVDVIKAYITEGRPLEDAFSRARSFSQKMKRKGRFVPRGKVAIDVGDSSSARQRAKAVA